MPGRFEGKVAVITGGTSGIGEATAHRFAQEGAAVALLARRVPKGKAVEKAIRQAGGEAFYVPCDISDGRDVETAVAAVIKRYGGLHVLFNNAGAAAHATFPEESDEIWEQVLRVNLTGTFLMCRAAWPHFLTAGGGAIVNVSSLLAVAGVSDRARKMTRRIPATAYIASKAGIEALSRHLAGLGARHRIRVNCVRPGQIMTPAVTTAVGKHAFADLFEVIQLLPGAGTADDVASAVLFLASDESRFITAEVINIDGGAAAKL